MSNFHTLVHRFELPPGSAEAGSSLVWALNGTLLVAVAATAVWLWNFSRRRDLARANDRIKRFVLSTPILIVLMLSGSFNIVTASYLGYEVPRDLLQDVESAKLWLQGRPAFPLNMTADIRATLEQEPAPSSADRWIPGLSEIEKTSVHRLITEPWAQAHPASMTLLLALFVPWLHVRLIQLLFGFASVAALAGTVWLLARGLNFPNRVAAIFFCGLLSWFPFWIVLRNGQVSMMLAFLMTLGWYCLRQERNVAAGIAVGIATALKLFPGLVFVYLLFRRRKAFWPGALTASSLLLFCFSLVGWHNTLDYFRVVSFVQEYYRDYKANLSLLSVFASVPRLDRWAPILAQICFLALLGLLLWTATRRSRDQAGTTTFDLEYAMFLALLPVLSPVSWDHYLVVLILPVAVLLACLRPGSPFAATRLWTVAVLFACLLLAIPQPFSAWGGRSLSLNHQFLLFKLPVLAVFAVFSVLWGMRMELARPADTRKFPPLKTAARPESNTVAA